MSHPQRAVFLGSRDRLVHTGGMTVVYSSIEAGAEVPEPRHYHERVVSVLSGECELRVNGNPQLAWSLLFPPVIYMCESQFRKARS